MSFLARLFDHPGASAPVAKERLKLVLAQERLRVSPVTKSVSVSFRGTREGLCVTLGDGPWRDLIHELTAQLSRPGAESLFKNARVHLETGNRSVGPSELEELAQLLALHQMTLCSVMGQVVEQEAKPPAASSPATAPPPATARPALRTDSADAAPPGGARAPGRGRAQGSAVPSAPPRSTSPAVPPPPEALPPGTRLVAAEARAAAPLPVPKPARRPRPEQTTQPAGGLPPPAELPSHSEPLPSGPALATIPRENPLQASQALLIRRTVRSGQVVHYAGTVVVFGDVNPAAEVIAEGDVIVLGKLRGVVHAGSGGNDSAVVGALILAPTQVRIGKQVARAPDEQRRHPWPAEIARIRGGQIVVEPWGV